MRDQYNETLSAGPQGELISKTDAVAIVLMCSRIYNLSEQEKWDKCAKSINSLSPIDAVPCEIADKVGEENERLTDRIGQLEEQMRWIPVSERLPEVTDTVLIQDVCGDIETAEVCMEYDESLVFYGEWEYKLEELVAWMPLPSPYRESEVKK